VSSKALDASGLATTKMFALILYLNTYVLRLVFQRLQQILQSIQFYFVHGLKQHTQLSVGKTFALKPFQVKYGQAAKQCTFVFTERHFHGNELKQQLWIGLHANFL
jgi:hypothetical protein